MSQAQNPSRNFLVSASAGSGKTYQLCKRFLHLVAAGADPAKILAITFTKKAAQEMRERILSDAQKLRLDPAEQESFRKQALEFSSTVTRTPLETAEAIIASSQRLSVKTIDALLMEWVSSHPWEANLRLPNEIFSPQIEFPMRLVDPTQKRDLKSKAWSQSIMRFFETHAAQKDLIHYYLKNEGAFFAENRLYRLFENPGSLWGRGLLDIQEAEENLWTNGRAPNWIENATEALRTLISSISNAPKKEAALNALIDGNVSELAAVKILNLKTQTVNGQTFAKAKREQFAAEISHIEQVWRNSNDVFLRRQGHLLLEMAKVYLQEYAQIKARRGLVEFLDLLIASYRLFFHPDAGAAQMMILQSIEHLILDEFQDTSSLQWQIFRTISEEILSGYGASSQNGRTGTIFIVGDAKQSIYGFREAQPELMNQVRDDLGHTHMELLTLDKNFRSSQLVLDLVNTVFQQNPVFDFATHETGGLVPNQGSVAVVDAFQKTPEAESFELEADYIADNIQFLLTTEDPTYQVFDKDLKTFRKIKPQDIAVLYPVHQTASRVQAALNKKGIANIRLDRRGFFDRSEIRDLLALMRYLAFPEDTVSLWTILRSPIFNISDEDLQKTFAKIETRAADRSSKLLEALPQTSAVSKLLNYKWSDANLTSFFLQLDNAFNIRKNYLNSYPGIEGEIALANCEMFFELAEELAQQTNGGLSELIAAVEEFSKESDSGISIHDAQCVQLLTIHAAKGLEWPVVILADTGRRWGRKDHYWLQNETEVVYIATQGERGANHPVYSALEAKVNDERCKELWRWLYVALTRPRHHLIVTGHIAERDVGLNEAFLPILQQAIASMPMMTQQGTSWSNQQVSSIVMQPPVMESKNQIAEKPKRSAPTLIPSIYQKELFTVAPSSLTEKEDECGSNPQIFSSQDAWRLVGTIVHAAFEEQLKSSKISPELFERSRYEGLFPDIDRILSHAKDLTTLCVQSNAWKELFSNSEFKIHSELPFVLRMEPNLFQGRMDVVILDSSGHAKIIDFKTAHSSFLTQNSYRAQLAVYRAAVQEIFQPDSIECILFAVLDQKLISVIGNGISSQASGYRDNRYQNPLPESVTDPNLIPDN